MASVGTMATSQEYKNLMQPILTHGIGLEPRKLASRCLTSAPRPRPSPFNESLSSFLFACVHWIERLWQLSPNENQQELTTLHPVAELI